MKKKYYDQGSQRMRVARGLVKGLIPNLEVVRDYCTNNLPTPIQTYKHKREKICCLMYLDTLKYILTYIETPVLTCTNKNIPSAG